MTLSLGAAADSAGAQSFVASEDYQIRKVVDAGASPSEITQVIDTMVDFGEIARRALGKPCPTTIPACTNHWDQLDATQQAEVTALFKQLVEKQIRENAAQTKGSDVTYRGVKEQGDAISRVTTRAKSRTTPSAKAVQFDYIIKCDPSCLMIDSVSGGSSFTTSYYDQSHTMLTTAGQGYPYFVQKLRDKIANKSTSGTH